MSVHRVKGLRKVDEQDPALLPGLHRLDLRPLHLGLELGLGHELRHLVQVIEGGLVLGEARLSIVKRAVDGDLVLKSVEDGPLPGLG